LIASRRQEFNRSWTPEKFERFRALLAAECGEGPQFRHSETPCFFPAEPIDQMARYGVELVEQLLDSSAYEAASRAAIPEAYLVPNEAAEPLFVQADFGLDDNLEPKLVEIQGFPSLYAYQPAMSDAYREAFGIDPALAQFPGELTAEQYWALLRKAIVGDKDPENVILLSIDPAQQKARHDYRITEKKFGVHAVDIRDLSQQGNRLFYPREGKLIPVDRIYNRANPDELASRGIKVPFDFRDDINVEWAGHPNWFFRLGKSSLPYFKHRSVPRADVLSEMSPIETPERIVLKPLHSYGGAEVIVGPSQEQVDVIPAEQRQNYILQERVNFEPVIDTPYGMTKVEVRILYVWTDEGMQHVNTMVRMGRGAQMGADFNPGDEWVGASAAFTEPPVQ
jgi:hypothetical protein